MTIIPQDNKKLPLEQLSAGDVFRVNNHHFVKGFVSGHTRFQTTKLATGEVVEMEVDEWVTPYPNAQLFLGAPAE